MALEQSEYDFWLLDLDGTLVDEWSYTREVFDRVGDRLGRGSPTGRPTSSGTA